MQPQSFSDKDIMTDLLSSQKFVTDGYNTFANECACPNLLADTMNILQEEHRIQSQVFGDMQKRGWYPTEAAEQQKISQVKQKYQAGCTSAS